MAAGTPVYPQNFGDNPVSMTCPNCRANVLTTLNYKSGLLVWILAGGCILFGCIFGCCLIPFCVRDLKDVEHTCPNCGSIVGIHKKLS